MQIFKMHFAFCKTLLPYDNHAGGDMKYITYRDMLPILMSLQ